MPGYRCLTLATRNRVNPSDDLNLFSHYTFKAPANSAEQVYALVGVQRLSSIWGRGTPPVLYFDLARPDARGQLNFKLPYTLAALQMTTNAANLQADAQALAQSAPSGSATAADYATAAHPAYGLLLKLTGNLNAQTYQMVPQQGQAKAEQY